MPKFYRNFPTHPGIVGVPAVMAALHRRGRGI
jgi:hypothetical protein